MKTNYSQHKAPETTMIQTGLDNNTNSAWQFFSPEEDEYIYIRTNLSENKKRSVEKMIVWNGN